MLKPTKYFFQFRRLLWCCVLSTSATSSAWADNGLNWKNGSDLLAVGLPALAAGAAWGQQDAEGIKQLTLSMASTVGAAELLKRTVKATRPDGSDDKSFPSGHTAVAFAAVRFMDKRYAQQVAPYRPWLYAAAGLTGLARVEADQHYWRDVAAGAVLGWGAATWWAEPIQGGQLTVLPSSRGLAMFWQRAW
jgi:membrane-associated phospholipid phosphatase